MEGEESEEEVDGKEKGIPAMTRCFDQERVEREGLRLEVRGKDLGLGLKERVWGSHYGSGR